MVGGSYQDPAETDYLHERFALARYNADGTLDSSFGAAGHTTTSLGHRAILTSLALQPDGKIVAADFGLAPPRYFAELVRYNADGSLDSTFGTSGIVDVDDGGQVEVLDVALQSDGHIVVAGWRRTHPAAEPNLLLRRFASDGTLIAESVMNLGDYDEAYALAAVSYTHLTLRTKRIV